MVPGEDDQSVGSSGLQMWWDKHKMSKSHACLKANRVSPEYYSMGSCPLMWKQASLLTAASSFGTFSLGTAKVTSHKEAGIPNQPESNT